MPDKRNGGSIFGRFRTTIGMESGTSNERTKTYGVPGVLHTILEVHKYRCLQEKGAMHVYIASAATTAHRRGLW